MGIDTTSVITSLDDPAARHPASVGEKAAALARLLQAGLPVPPGFVVSAEAFSEAVAPLAEAVDGHLSTASDGLRALQEASDAIRALITELPVPAALSNAVAAAYDSMGADAVAVRSSGTAEDLPDASFAGQYDSYLNVLGVDTLIESLLAVWASVYSPQAVAYRRDQGVPHEAAKMAVLVQRQLAPAASGVLFTRDPVTGAADRMFVNATFGLGEGVVSGEAQADTFALDAESMAVVDRTVAEKTTMVVVHAAGGIGQRTVPKARHTEPALSDGQLAELGRLARSVRELEGGDRDIEFAIVDGDVYLLQARPVTGLDGGTEADAATGEGGGFPVVWEDPDDEQYSWTLASESERPTPVTRFIEDARRVAAANMKVVFQDTGVPMARPHILRFFNGYPYFRWPDVSEDEVSARQRKHQAMAATYAERGVSYYDAVIEPETIAILGRLGPFRRPAGESLESRMAQLDSALEAYGHVMGDLHWRMAGANMASTFDWPGTYAKLTGGPAVDSGTLLQAIDNLTTRLVSRLRRLARIVQSDEALRDIFRTRAYARLREPGVRERPAVGRFRARFRALLRAHGRRTGHSFGSSTQFGAPTWNLDHRQPLDFIAAYADQDLDELDRLEAAARRERVRATRRAPRGIKDVADRERFEAALRGAQDHVRIMENHNNLMEQGVNGVLREAIWWLGQGFVRAGRLEDADDATQLSVDELRAASRPGRDDDLRPLVLERVAEFERRSQMRPPRRLGEGERQAPPPRPPGADGGPGDGAGLDGTLLRGVAASRGRHTGRARVFLADGELPVVERGDILVARNAGQDWTPVLPLLGGIVLDEGVVFQHAALIAREYRVPCVLQTRDATKAIADGQIVTIDGTEGVVELAPADA